MSANTHDTRSDPFSMKALLTMLPLVALSAIIYVVARTIAHAYIEHRVRMAILEKLEKRPELLGQFQELEEILENPTSAGDDNRRQDLVLTGVILAVIGAVCTLAYSRVGGGEWAVGAYWGGVTCVVLGFLLVLLGLLVRFLSRPPAAGDQERH